MKIITVGILLNTNVFEQPRIRNAKQIFRENKESQYFESS